MTRVKRELEGMRWKTIKKMKERISVRARRRKRVYVKVIVS